MSSAFLDWDSQIDSETSSIEEAYAYCEQITRESSTSFLRSFRYLDQNRRNAVYAMYAFCRRVDDIVDGDWRPTADLSHLDSLADSRSIQMTVDRQSEASSSSESYIERVRALLWFNQNLDRIEEGKDVSDLLFVALADAMKNYPIQMTHLRTLIQGMEDDLFPTNYCSFEDLRTYCFKVASTVGLCLIDIYGYSDPNAREHAEEMGIFLQMVNVLRDIQEDLERGRIYLPKDELERFGIEISQLTDTNLASTKEWKEFMRHYIHRVRTHRDNALKLLPLLDSKARRSPAVMCTVYDEILLQAERRQGDVLTKRLGLGFVQKIRIALGSLGIWDSK